MTSNRYISNNNDDKIVFHLREIIIFSLFDLITKHLRQFHIADSLS